MPTPGELNNSYANGEILKSFQLERDINSKLDKEYGKRIAMYIDSTLSGTSSYIWLRNERYKANRRSANGRVDMTKYQDLLEMNGKTNYLNINWSSIKIVNRIISGLVGRWMQRKEKIHVNCIDPISIKAKQDNYEEAERVLYNKEQIAELEAKSGVPMTPPDQFIAEDQDELEIWFQEAHRLPEEIKYEKESNNILDSEGWFDVLKEKSLHDSAEVGFVGAYVWMDEYGVIHVEWVKPENAFYSYSEFPDLRDTQWRGRMTSPRISEIRRKYGKEFGGDLTEEDLWQLAQSCKEYQQFDKLRWLPEWTLAIMRPYDEWNLDIMEFELKSVDDDGYVVTQTKEKKSTLLRKSGKPQNLDENQEFIDSDKWNIYRCAYARSHKKVLEWGLKKNMIRSQDPKESGNVEFSYSYYMYQNYDMRNMAIPEKIEEPSEQMIIARLKMQQLVAKMIPYGAAINWDAMQEVNLGMTLHGEVIDPQKYYQQTGVLYYRGRDAEGNPIPVPITELANAGFLQQMQGLIQLYEVHYKILKDELGEDPNLITAAAQPRVTSENVQASQQMADYSTDYMYDAYTYLTEDVGKKIACLLNWSVKEGAKIYREITKEEVEGRNFSTRIKLLPDAFELQKFEAFMNQMLANSPDLIMFVDPFKLMRIAKEDVKLAEQLFRQAQKRMLKNQQQQQQAAQEQQVMGAKEAANAKAEGDLKLAQTQAQLEILKADAQSKAANESTLLSGLMELYKTGIPIPPELSQLKNLVFTNVAMSLAGENRQMVQEQMMAAQQQQQEAQETPEQEMQEQQQPEMAMQ